MKLRKLWAKSEFDEMQEQTARKIESRGFWLMWVSLLTAIIVQILMKLPFYAMAGEWIIFMASCVYTLAAFLHNGLFDRHLKPSLTTSILSALAAAAAAGILQYFVSGFVLAAVITAVITALLTFLLMQLVTVIYNKRHHQLESEPNNSEDKT